MEYFLEAENYTKLIFLQFLDYVKLSKKSTRLKFGNVIQVIRFIQKETEGQNEPLF